MTTTGSHSTVRAWTGAGRLRVWWARWTQDGWVWADPAESSTIDRGGERMPSIDDEIRRAEHAAQIRAALRPFVRAHQDSTEDRLPEELVDRLLGRERERLDAALVENELLREAFTEAQVIYEDPHSNRVSVRVPRHVWLRLRAWRAADPGNGRAGSRWWRFSYGELQALHAVIDHSDAIDVPEHLREPTMAVFDELRAELAARVDEAAGS